MVHGHIYDSLQTSIRDKCMTCSTLFMLGNDMFKQRKLFGYFTISSGMITKNIVLHEMLTCLNKIK